MTLAGLVLPDNIAAGSKKKEKKEKPEAVPAVLGMILWPDGGAKPNPGFAGWGLHGYLFDHAEPTKGSGNPDHVPTINGYITKVDKALNDKVKAVSPVKYFDGLGSFDSTATNNVAEIEGATQGMVLVDQYDVVSATFYIDSKYVLGGIEHMRKWAANNWLLSDGNPVKNQDYWKRLQAAHAKLVAKGVKLRFEWTRGHNGDLGNEIADRLATIGVRHSAAGILKSEVQVKEAQGYWKYDAERHPFINHRRMYFNSVAQYVVPGEYYIGEHESDDDMAGKRMANGAYALIRLAKPDPMLEEIRTHTCNLAGGTNSIMLARLDYAYRAEMHEPLRAWGGVVLDRANQERLDLFNFKDKEPLAKEMRPPKLVQRSVNAIVELSQVLSDFLEKKDNLVISDLTSILYETEVTVKKDVEVHSTRLRPEFKVGTSELDVNMNYRRPDGSIDSVVVKLTLGMDLLDRNGLRRLEESSPKVSLVSWSEAPQAFRFATVIQANDDVGIWAGFYSNLRIILPKTE